LERLNSISNSLKFDKSKDFSDRLSRLVPGGAHTYSRGPDQFPTEAPNGISHGVGAYVWDADGNRLLDWGMALGSVSLGHADPGVTEAVCEAVRSGVNFTRPSALELEAVEVFLSVTGEDMVKFSRHGSAVTTAAVKLSRAYTGRHKVAVPKEHPFFSYDDWFIGTTVCDFGIPEAIKGFTLQFSYNDTDSLRQLFEQHPGEIACVMLEPVKIDAPVEGFLQRVRDLCTKHGAVLVFDEMVSGLKWAVPGAGALFGIEPDLTTWGKGIANGFACSALAGKRELMELGGINREGLPKLFLLSSTHGPESVGLAAMIATMKAFKAEDVVGRNWQTGRNLRQALEAVINRHELSNALKISGYPCVMALDVSGPEGTPDLAFRTLFIQEVLARGVLFQGVFVLTPSHGQTEIDQTVAAFDGACEIFKAALEVGTTDGVLVGPPIKPVFRKTV
jgi:glutamate-1-semialdehyde 2,1-aminomutase